MTKTYKYDAFGVEKDIDNSDTNAFRYCGEYYDAETGTIYLRARYYNPSTGRFISRDSFVGENEDPLSLNRYTYCHNNPIVGYDPSGHFFSELWDGIKSAAGAVKDWAKEFGSDALQCGKDFYNAQCERTDKFFNKPNLLNFVDYVSFGWCSANEERFNRADDLYGVVNYVSLGALDMVNGAFNPEKPYSFDHVMNSIGVASLVVGAYAESKVKTESPLLKNKKVYETNIETETSYSTGRTIPNNLMEQLSMEKVKSNPLENAHKIPIELSDPRWPASEGWVKMQSVVEYSSGKTVIHFVYNTITGEFDDFKFK